MADVLNVPFLLGVNSVEKYITVLCFLSFGKQICGPL